MAFNVAEFRANGLIEGGARPTLFMVTLTFPAAIGVDPNAGQRAQFLVQAADLPASILNKVSIPYFGRKIQLAGDRDFPDWRCRIMNDEDFSIRNSLEAWHNSIDMIVANVMMPEVAGIIPQLGNSYKTDGLVTQFAKTGPGDIDGPGAIKTYKFSGMFPIEIDAIPVDWNETNTIEVFNCTWAYDWWEPYNEANEVPIFPIDVVAV